MKNHQSANTHMVSTLTETERAIFYRKTYTHLAGAVLLFVVVETLFFQIPFVLNFALSLTEGYSWLIMLGAFLFITNYAERLALKSDDNTMHYLALLLYIVAEAFIFIPLIFIALSFTEDGSFNILNQAAIMTLSLFTGLSAIVLLTRKDFSFLKSILSVGFAIAVGLIVAGILFGFNLGLLFSAVMVILASGSILYQTSNLVHKYKSSQYIAASLGLFASLMLLFWYILNIHVSD